MKYKWAIILTITILLLSSSEKINQPEINTNSKHRGSTMDTGLTREDIKAVAYIADLREPMKEELSGRLFNVIRSTDICTKQELEKAILTGDLTPGFYQGDPIRGFGKTSFIKLCEYVGVDSDKSLKTEEKLNVRIEKYKTFLESQGYDVVKKV